MSTLRVPLIRLTPIALAVGGLVVVGGTLMACGADFNPARQSLEPPPTQAGALVPTFPGSPLPSSGVQPTGRPTVFSPRDTPQLSTSTPVPGADVVATRVRIPSLEIDLPVVAGDLDVPGNQGAYPLCDVAMYMPQFVAPGLDGTTYIYAHAQRGMFLPLLRASEIDDGAAMLGAEVEVYTSSGQLHLYQISQVKRHATDLSLANVEPGEHRLVLQTSEGPTGTVPKLQIAASPVSVADVSSTEANPEARPRVCLPA